MPNFQSYLRRLCLNEHLRRLYTLSGSYMPKMTAHYDKLGIWSSLNCLLHMPSKVVEETKIERVRRRLFREPKKRPRKLQKPKRKTMLFSKCFYFKAYRHLVGKQRIRRNFLDIPRPHLYIEQLGQAMHSTNYICRDEVFQPYLRKACTWSDSVFCKRCNQIYVINLNTSDNTEHKQMAFEEAERNIEEIKAILKIMNDYANTTVDDEA